MDHSRLRHLYPPNPLRRCNLYFRRMREPRPKIAVALGQPPVPRVGICMARCAQHASGNTEPRSRPYGSDFNSRDTIDML